MNDDPLKICTKCGESKTLSEFYPDPRVKCGHRADCKVCEKKRRINCRVATAEYMRNRHLKKRGVNWPAWVLRKREFWKRLKEGDIIIGEGQKLCTTCWKVRPLSIFYKNKIRKTGISNKCQICSSAAGKKYESTHREKRNERVRQWVKENPEKAREKSRKSSKKSRSTTRGRLRGNLSSAIWLSLKGESKRGHRWEYLVGYSVDQLKRHLEKLFEPGMSWENYGKYGWHVDHKIPVSAFNFETPDDLDFKRCWALKNLQPLEAKKNQSKSAKVERPFQPSLAINAIKGTTVKG